MHLTLEKHLSIPTAAGAKYNKCLMRLKLAVDQRTDDILWLSPKTKEALNTELHSVLPKIIVNVNNDGKQECPVIDALDQLTLSAFGRLSKNHKIAWVNSNPCAGLI